MPAVVDRVYHILLCNQKSYTHPRAQRALPACCFWTCIKAQRGTSPKSFALLILLLERAVFFSTSCDKKNDPISYIGFVGHCHYAFTAYGKVPVEIYLYQPSKPSIGLHHRRHYRLTIYGQEPSCQQMGFRNLSNYTFHFVDTTVGNKFDPS
ncbi:hypothetical protein CEXT_300981 [Caerostris extrusa]|uniref:Uncharacterized protein n=1 Tax=Caerostris extrusa TaxID=172846 RepID=A0AAV4MSE3_CAEEX|nr:hypothetical protein CEXT_300981 [Caerostris extrusa]